VFDDIVIGGSPLVGFLCASLKAVIEYTKIADVRNKLWARLVASAHP
jgi:hypothetical protein